MGNLNVVGPNEAVVVSGGCFTNDKTIVSGSWAWSWWLCSDVQTIGLQVMTIIPHCDDVETTEGVRLSVTGVAQCKVMHDHDFLKVACEQFLGKTRQEIRATLLGTLEGHLRCILGSLTVEQVYRDRDQFAGLVRDVASPDLARMGIEVLSFTIKDVYDNVEYLSSLGRTQTASVVRDADIAKAEAERDATIVESECTKTTQEAKYKADTAVADSLRELQNKQAGFNIEVNTAQAQAELAYDLQANVQQQDITKELVNIDIVERKKLVDVEVNEILRKEKELDAVVRKPAEAEAFKLEKIAEGKRLEKIAAAQGGGEKIKLIGKAEAESLELIGKAEAERLLLRGDVFKRYGTAAITQLILRKLPLLAAEIAAPLANVEDIVMIGDDKLSSELLKLIANLPPSIQALTGKNITELINSSGLK